jgi:hypothetical protein
MEEGCNILYSTALPTGHSDFSFVLPHPAIPLLLSIFHILNERFRCYPSRKFEVMLYGQRLWQRTASIGKGLNGSQEKATSESVQARTSLYL